MKRTLLVVAVLLLCLGIPFAIFYINTGEQNTEKLHDSSRVVASTESLSECELYYRDVFRNAQVYGTFEDFPATTAYTGPIATVDEESHRVAKRFFSYHKTALEQGVTFAGKYTISNWAFTGWGQMFAVVDVETGAVYPFPYVVDWDIDFRPDSNLIVINPIDSVPEFYTLGPNADISCDAKWFDDMKTYYFVFEDNQFKLLGPATTTPTDLLTTDWLSDT